MSIIAGYNDPIIAKKNYDTEGNPISLEMQPETHTIKNGKITLIQIPDKFYRVQINGMTELYGYDNSGLQIDNYRVDYTNGIVMFNISLEGQQITVNKYYGNGYWLISDTRIYTKKDDLGNITETLDEVMDKIDDALELSNQIQEVEDIRINNENTRTANENNRLLAENQRLINEQTREDEEVIRINNESERILKEQERIQSEIIRVQNELIRMSNEDERIILKSQLDILKVQLEDLRDGLIEGNFGDMFKIVYDSNNNGKVDVAENAEKLGEQLPEYYAKSHDLANLAGDSRTTETVKGNTDALNAHNADYIRHRKIFISSEMPTELNGENGDVWLKYDATGWYNIQNYITELSDANGIAYNGKIYAFGGRKGSPASPVSTNDLIEYNPATDEWKVIDVENLITPSHSIFVFLWNHRMYITNNTIGMWYFDFVEYKWVQVASFPTDFSPNFIAPSNNVVVFGDEALFVYRNATSIVLRKYNIALNTWDIEYVIPTNEIPYITNFTVTKFSDDEIFFHGGLNGSTVVSNAYKINKDSYIVTPIQGLHPSRRTHRLLNIGDRIYLYGGNDVNGATNSLLMYSISTNTWTTLASNTVFAPNGQRSCLIERVNSNLYIMGGVDLNNNYLSLASRFAI